MRGSKNSESQMVVLRQCRYAEIATGEQGCIPILISFFRSKNLLAR